MTRTIRTLYAPIAATLLAALAGSAQGAPPGALERPAESSGRSCFYARSISSWAPQGDTTVNLRVNAHDFYQLQLLSPCPNIDWDQGIGVEHRGTSWICSGLDAVIIARGPGGPNRCPAVSVRKLSKDEVAALPPKARP
jgi:hypothetical protein